MKKKLILALAVLTAAGLMAGCGKKTEEAPETDSAVSTADTADTADTAAGTQQDVPDVFLRDIDVASYLTLQSDYKGLSLSADEKAEVTEQQILDLALQAYNTTVTAEAGGISNRAVVEGDTVNIDYEGKKDGVAFDGGTAAGQDLTIGSGRFIDGFEDGLIGVTPGETVDLNLTFPENYGNADLAGQEVVFTVTVNFIYPSSREEMADATIEALTEGDFVTVDAFLDYCRDYLEYSAESSYRAARENAVIVQLESIAVFESLPEELVAKYNAAITEALNIQAAGYGLDADTFCTYYFQMDAASYAQQAAEASARQGMIFQYIADKEGLNLSDEELEESLQQYALEVGVESVDELLVNADREDYREYFMFEKVVDFLFENAAQN